MIPLRDNVPTRRFPVITVTIIVINVFAYLYDTLVAAPIGHFGPLTGAYSLVPVMLWSDPASAMPALFISIFLHANLLHVGGNMLYLWIFGNNIEDTLGRARFLTFYLVCGLAASLLQVASNPGSDIPILGASGAVAGMMGAYLILFPQAEVLTFVPVFFFATLIEMPAVVVIGFWAIIQLINASWAGGGGMLQGGGVAYFAHIGGFLAGMLLISFLGGRALTERQRRPYDDFRYQR